jgi:DUF4097 and DUF4098 domain-containing protein YvlB
MFGSVKIAVQNGRVNVSNVTADGITVESVNGSLDASKLSAKTAVLECYNAQVSVSDIDARKLSVSTCNGGLDMHIADFSAYNEYDWALECNNGNLNLALPHAPDTAYSIKARAALSTVKLGVTGMNYIHNEKDYVEAKSYTYDSSVKKVNIALESSNAPITVN